jgi:hypothetical protein
MTPTRTLGLIEPNFSDRQRRTPEQVRKLADKALRDLRRPSKGNKRHGKGNKRYYPQPDGIDPATKCALIVSIKLNWPAPRNRRTQAMCEALYAAVGGDVKRRGGTPNRAERDGFWRDHLRMAQSKQWRDTLYSRTIERALTL